MDDKKEAVATTPFSEKKLLITEKVTTSDDVHKRTKNIITSEEVVKGTKQCENMKRVVVIIYRKDPDNFEGQSKRYTG